MKGKKIDGKCWAERDKDVIHADVLVDLVAVIDDAFMNESQRSISRYASGQKEVDDELRDGFCTQIYSTRCHRSMKYVIPCHD